MEEHTANTWPILQCHDSLLRCLGYIYVGTGELRPGDSPRELGQKAWGGNNCFVSQFSPPPPHNSTVGQGAFQTPLLMNLGAMKWGEAGVGRGTFLSGCDSLGGSLGKA